MNLLFRKVNTTLSLDLILVIVRLKILRRCYKLAEKTSCNLKIGLPQPMDTVAIVPG